MKTQRLTMSQALVQHLAALRVEMNDGTIQPYCGGVFTIFGHGNVAGLGEALEAEAAAHGADALRYLQARNEQGMVHAAAAYAKQKRRMQAFACTTSIGPGATNMVTGAAMATVNRLPVLLDVGADFVSSAAPEAGSFRCDNPLMNDIHDMVARSVRSNLQSVLTDCPHREKLGWLEVAHLMGPSILYRYDAHGLYRKICRDTTESQLDSGLVPDIAPEYTRFNGGFFESPEWGSASVQLPWLLYRWYGDDGILAAQLTGGAAGAGAEVQVARSSWALPVFQRLALDAAVATSSVVLPPQQV